MIPFCSLPEFIFISYQSGPTEPLFFIKSNSVHLHVRMCAQEIKVTIGTD